MMCFPLAFKSVQSTTALTAALDKAQLQAQPDLLLLPLSEHPGAFGVKRKHHIHEGIDLYAPAGASVFSVTHGVVRAVEPFTGPAAQSPWWHDTWSVLVEHELTAEQLTRLGLPDVPENRFFCLNYAEITPLPEISPGQPVYSAQLLGHVQQVLRVDKGRPMSMLHLERYRAGVPRPIKEWPLGCEKPQVLDDPTPLLIQLLRLQGKFL